MEKLTKKQKIDKIIGLIAKMEQNTFLLPESWSETMNMVSRSAHYRTYVGRRGSDRYINIEYTKNDELYNPKIEDCYKINIKGNNIIIEKLVGSMKNEVDNILDIVEAIYKEKISFEIMDGEIVKKRLKLKELKQQIIEQTKEFNTIKKCLLDYDNLKQVKN